MADRSGGAEQDKIEALRREYEGLKYSEGARREGRRGDRFLRVPRLHQVMFQGSEGGQRESSGLVADLQLTTLRLLTSRDIPAGTAVTVTLEIEEGELLTVNGVVKWSNEVTYLSSIQEAVSHVQAVELALPEKVTALIQDYLLYKRQLPEANLVNKVLDIHGRPPLP